MVFDEKKALFHLYRAFSHPRNEKESTLETESLAAQS